MKFVTFNTSMSKKEVYLTLKEMTKSESDNSSFIGDIKEDCFSVMKYQHFSNNVLNPQIHATVIENKKSTEINMKASLNKYDKIAFSIMGIVVCVIFIFLIISAIVSGILESVFSVVGLLFFIILVFVLSGCVFALKAKRIFKILKTKLS